MPNGGLPVGPKDLIDIVEYFKSKYDRYIEKREVLDWVKHANQNFESNDLIRANLFIEKAINSDILDKEDLWELWLTKATILIELGKNKDAIVAADRAFEIKPEEVHPLYAKILALFNLGRYKEAIEVCDLIIKKESKNADVWILEGYAFTHYYAFKEAIKCFDEAIRIDPTGPKAAVAWMRKGDIELDDKTAIECYDKAIGLNLRYTPAWQSKGNKLYFMGKYPDAIECYDKVIEYDQQNANAWAFKYFCLNKLGRQNEAQATFNRVTEIDPEIFSKIGDGLDRLDMMMEQFELVSAHIDEGISFSLEEDYEKTLVALEKAINVDPNNALAWHLKGEALKKIGRFTDARAAFSKAKELGI